MAVASQELVQHLRNAANQLESGDKYMWGHMGCCNCGHLAQSITRISRAEIHAYALQRHGDWEEQTVEYCPTSGYPIDLVIKQMLAVGLSLHDLRELERLSNPRVLAILPPHELPLRHNDRLHAIRYMRAWADLLEQELTTEPTWPLRVAEPERVG
jgi:hypothetical protein